MTPTIVPKDAENLLTWAGLLDAFEAGHRLPKPDIKDLFVYRDTDPRLDRATTAHVRLFISGSAPLSPATHADWRDRTGHAILERYGMTETNMITSNPYEGDRRAGSV